MQSIRGCSAAQGRRGWKIRSPVSTSTNYGIKLLHNIRRGSLRCVRIASEATTHDISTRWRQHEAEVLRE